MNVHDKRRIALWYWLQGKGWQKALEAFTFAAGYHVGFRKDGVTPEFSHQIEIAHHVRTLPDVASPEDALCVALLHDVMEDYHVSIEELRGRFGDAVAAGVERMSKVFRGNRKRDDDYFGAIGRCPIASLVKACDRIHNLNTMSGVFSREKQAAYVDEGETLFMPMLKEARRVFPTQERAYQNLRLTMGSQIRLIREALEALAA